MCMKYMKSMLKSLCHNVILVHNISIIFCKDRGFTIEECINDATVILFGLLTLKM